MKNDKERGGGGGGDEGKVHHPHHHNEDEDEDPSRSADALGPIPIPIHDTIPGTLRAATCQLQSFNGICRVRFHNKVPPALRSAVRKSKAWWENTRTGTAVLP